MTLPIYLTNRAQSLASVLDAANTELDLNNAYNKSIWENFVDELNYDELEEFFQLFKIEPLFTRIFTVGHMRRILAQAWRIQRLRGTRQVLEIFSEIMDITYSFTFQRDRLNRKVGLQFFITPPINVVPGANWQRYMRRSFEFLVPGRQVIAEFRLGLELRNTNYVYSALTPLRSWLPYEGRRVVRSLSLLDIPPLEASANALWTYELQPRGGTEPYSFELVRAPNWLSIVGNNLQGTPPAEMQVTGSVILKDSAGANARAAQSFTLDVGPEIIIIVPLVQPDYSNVNAEVFRPILITLDVQGGTGTLIVTVTGLPRGLSFDASTRQITGIVESAGTSTITVTITDEAEAMVSDMFDIIVAAATGPLSMPQPANLDVRIGDQVNVILPSAFGGNPPYRVYAIAGDIGRWGLTFNNRNRVLSGTIRDPRGITSAQITYFVRDEDSSPNIVIRRFRINLVT